MRVDVVIALRGLPAQLAKAADHRSDDEQADGDFRRADSEIEPGAAV